jgi:hypothetical protein
MKQFLFLCAIALTLSFLMCNTTTDAGRPAVLRSDTTKNVMCVYKDIYDGKAKSGFTDRIIKDSFMYVYADTFLNNKRRWMVDTSYLEKIPVPVDSARSIQYKMPIRDSLGRQNFIIYDVVVHKRFVRSGWNGVDSALL